MPTTWRMKHQADMHLVYAHATERQTTGELQPCRDSPRYAVRWARRHPAVFAQSVAPARTDNNSVNDIDERWIPRSLPGKHWSSRV